MLDRRSTISLGRPGSKATGSKISRHKKSASSYAAGSALRGSVGNLPFLLQRLDFQKSQDKANHRDSSDGQQRLQEEFNKLQNGHQTTCEEDEADDDIDWDFWGNVIADYRQFATDHPEKLAKAIEQGVPKSLRGMVWQLMSASKDAELEATYLRLLKETSPHEKAILRDLGRTFPHHDYFTDGHGIGQENLFNVLKAYSLYDPEVGYCQGLPFVVAILLLNMPDEEAFCLLVRLMHSYGLRSHFLPEMPGLQLRMYQFDRLVEELLPVLHVHFLRQGIKSSMYCSQWFLTLFSYRFPLEIVFRIYDNILASGIEAVFGFSVVLLQKSEEALLKLKFDEILTFLKNRLFEFYNANAPSSGGADTSTTSSLNDGGSSSYLVDKFVMDALQLKITPFMLDAYAHEYDETVRTREAHMIEMDTIRNANRQLTAQVKTLETSLAQLNTEHCDLVKELVMMRIRSEEMENELVRYKLLYAEAMHQNEDAMSSHRLSTFSAPK
ncbi:RabGAP/TBC [Fomitiporia mediterranea MF3/22]|uniref:RabGAP/TBC n=1 Tax=Fomitiporia mediterranea (strain MF3/22) TaxID=694068 RepID=UPI00044088D8|nr:RabGAP/TBC [Fomitiporia mediterranea MF3/22]EJD02967.1 RabGAP/TBC [Fomitiporia mediterranea MF3/22]